MEDKQYLEDIKNSLSLEQIEDLLAELGGEPQRHGNIIINKTICHSGDSHKLYYYGNTHLFRCFTQCGDAFDIFELVQKVTNRALPQAINYIVNYFNLSIKKENFFKDEDLLEDWKILNKYKQNISTEKEEKIVELKVYNKNILKYLPRPRIPMWEQEGITREIMNRNNICYNPSSQAIVIPHYNIDGDLIGIRERTLIKENEINGKYRPSIIDKIMYNHPLGYNLYNINNSKNNIKRIQKAIVFEGEKSPMLYQSYFGIENDISVACCGSSLISYQVQLLLSLGVKEICIAFDKQFKELGDEEFKGWTKKLKDINKKYSPFVKISFIFDKENLLDYKNSPIDKGKEIFIKLYNNRIYL
jgi:hypothetical protein